MPTEKIPPKDRIVASFNKLTTASGELKAAVTDLSRSIGLLEHKLELLGLGVSAWYPIASHTNPETGYHWSRDVGYTQFGRRWRIALRKMWSDPEEGQDHEDIWTFDDAPRWMVIEAVGKIPDLFEDLLKRTEDTTKKIRNRAVETRAVADALEAAVFDALQGQEIDGKAK